MKKILLPLLFVVAAMLTFGAACTTVSPNTFAGLQSAGSCTIETYTFSNFVLNGSSFAAGGGAIDPTKITFGVIDTSASVGFSFNTSQYTVLNNAGQTADINFTYTVAGPANSIWKVAAIQNAGVTGTGDVSVTETVCPGPTYSGTCGALGSFSVDTNSTNSGALSFAPQAQITINKDIYASTGTSGTAHLSDLQNTLVIPEPMTMSLLGLGLLGLGFFGRKVRK